MEYSKKEEIKIIKENINSLLNDLEELKEIFEASKKALNEGLINQVEWINIRLSYISSKVKIKNTIINAKHVIATYNTAPKSFLR